ncbi:hypothetical protein CPC08DRAFT_822791 [Agrocybe pediades]|nr:hypothetical protein CPC08DRAFT_822791 [Agrocybe pediades]
MTFSSKAASVLGYRVRPTSFLALTTYLVILVALSITDVLPNVPAGSKQGGLNLEEAYEDLRHIAARPHPYNSHANDVVREYLLSRLSPLVKEYTHVHISDDLVSNGSWAGPAYGSYFEGTNILVKIDGTGTGGVLFSAHYDSVSTASGATDDGMGVATILQLVQYFAKHRPERTAIFNINNGEEDWLNGAHAFLQHPWSATANVFLNLEGAAAGGRPILFRATSTSPVRSFRDTKLVPHPHANVLSSDAFSRGLIRSGTDYSVYTGPGATGGMEGLDLAFYKGRSRYHTKYDAVQYTLGGKKSLWSMMETAKGVGISLLEGPREATGGGEPVYFDLFKSVLVVFPLSNLLTFNVVVLVAGPILLILLLVFEKVVSRKRKEHETHEEEEETSPPGYFHRGASSRHHEATEAVQEHVSWTHTVWRHAKFWVSLVGAVGLQVLFMWIYILVNPFAIYSSPYIVLCSFVTLAYLCLMFILTLPSSLPFYHPKGEPTSNHFILPPAQQLKHTLFFHLYAFTWILLVLSTIGITKVHPGIGGGYVVSAWNACVGIACVICAIEGLVGSKDSGGEYEGISGEEVLPGESRHADERTPLIIRESQEDVPSSSRHHHFHSHHFDGGSLATWWWIPQFVVSVPFPIILLGHMTMLVLDGMTQSLADGASAWTVYALTSLPAVLLVIPLVPFAYKLRPSRPLSMFVTTAFILSTLYALLIFPFSVDVPLKVYFQQRVEYPTTSSPLQLVAAPNVSTLLIGPSRYIKTLVASLPSSSSNPVCKEDKAKIGLMNCKWQSGDRMLPVPGAHTDSSIQREEPTRGLGRFFHQVGAVRTGPSSAMITVQGVNTRSCRVYFDQPIFGYAVRPPTRSEDLPDRGHDQVQDPLLGSSVGAEGMQEGYEIGQGGIKEVRLWSRTWDRQFEVDVNLKSPSCRDCATNDTRIPMQGKIACEWAEYESGMIDNGNYLHPLRPYSESPLHESEAEAEAAPTQAKIPALEEALAFLPHWSTVSKAADGLVEVLVPFAV